MKISLRRSRESGLLSVKLTPENRVLEEFFETEIQNDLGLVEHLLARINAAGREAIELNGNAFSLQLMGEHYTITPLFDASPPVSGPREDFLRLLQHWHRRLRRDSARS